MATEFYIIRHGEAEGNLYRTAQGHCNGKLTPTGLKQIARVSERFRDVHIDAAYSSDLERAYETGRAVCDPHGVAVVKDPRFREVNLGIWEEMPWGEILRDYAEQYRRFSQEPYRWNVRGCEGFRPAGERFVAALEERAAEHRGGCVAVFAHGCVIRAALMEVFARDPSMAGRPAGHSDNTAVTHLFVEDDGRIRVDYLNDNSHLGTLSTMVRHLPKLGEQQFLMNFCFRPLQKGDLDLYRASREEVWRLLYGDRGDSQAESFMLDAWNTARQHRGSVTVATYREEFAGFLQLNPLKGADSGACHISFLYLKPELRGLSMGVQLLGVAVRQARRWGRDRLTLRVSTANDHARGFYEYYGFTPLSAEAGTDGSELILMQKTI